MALGHSRMLMRYNEWANRVTFDAVAGLPAQETTRPRQSLFGNMVHTLNHNHVIGLIWQAHLEGRVHGFAARNSETPPPLEELRRAQQATDLWYVQYADALEARALEERLDIVLIGGNRVRMSRGEILLHVVNHTTYHRGFVADMFYQVPARPPLTDLPVYLREHAA